MGCTHYFVVDRLEDLVDEGDSRSPSRIHARIFGLFHNCMWQSRHPKIDVHLFELEGPVSTNGSPSFYLDLHLRLCLCLCLSLYVRQTNCSILAIKGETCIDFLSTRTGRLFCHRSLRSMNWIRVWLGWLGAF